MGRPRKHPLAPKGISGKLPVVPRRKDSIFTYTAVELDKAREQLAAALEDRRVLQEQLIQAEDHIDEVAESMEATFDQERKGLFAALDRSYEFIATISKTNIDLSYRLEKSLLDREAERELYSGDGQPSGWARAWENLCRATTFLVIFTAAWFGIRALINWAMGTV